MSTEVFCVNCLTFFFFFFSFFGSRGKTKDLRRESKSPGDLKGGTSPTPATVHQRRTPAGDGTNMEPSLSLVDDGRYPILLAVTWEF